MALRGRDSIKRVGLVGGGVIGTGWTIRALAHGLDVSITDPAPGAGRAPAREHCHHLAHHGSERSHRWSKPRAGDLCRQHRRGGESGRLHSGERARAGRSENCRLQRNLSALPRQHRHCVELVGVVTQPYSIRDHPSGAGSHRAPGFRRFTFLPLVEVMGGEKTTEEAKKKAAGYYSGIGMRPIARAQRERCVSLRSSAGGAVA